MGGGGGGGGGAETDSRLALLAGEGLVKKDLKGIVTQF